MCWILSVLVFITIVIGSIGILWLLGQVPYYCLGFDKSLPNVFESLGNGLLLIALLILLRPIAGAILTILFSIISYIHQLICCYCIPIIQ